MNSKPVTHKATFHLPQTSGIDARRVRNALSAYVETQGCSIPSDDIVGVEIMYCISENHALDAINEVYDWTIASQDWPLSRQDLKAFLSDLKNKYA